MESQENITTTCPDCQRILIVPTITDWGITYQVAPAKCDCGFEQKGIQNDRGGFIADNPIGYYNLRNAT